MGIASMLEGLRTSFLVFWEGLPQLFMNMQEDPPFVADLLLYETHFKMKCSEKLWVSVEKKLM